MSIQFQVDLNKAVGANDAARILAARAEQVKPGFTDTVKQSFSKINGMQEEANTSILELLSGKQQDVNSVVASVAQADMSFKLLVGVRNKLIEAYKETMKMQG